MFPAVMPYAPSRHLGFTEHPLGAKAPVALIRAKVQPTRPARKPGTQLVPLDGDWLRECELYRMRTQSEQYHPGMVEIMLEWAHVRARQNDLLVVDCHTCKRTILMHEDADTCPHCGGDLS